MGENWRLALRFGTFFTSFSSFLKKKKKTKNIFPLWSGKCSEESNFTLLSEIMKTFFHWITKIWLFSAHKQQRRKISLVVGHTHLHCLFERWKKKIAFFTLIHSLLSCSSHLIFICEFIRWVVFFFFLFHSKSIYQNLSERISIQMRRAYVTNWTIANDAWYAGDEIPNWNESNLIITAGFIKMIWTFRFDSTERERKKIPWIRVNIVPKSQPISQSHNFFSSYIRNSCIPDLSVERKC